MTDQVLPPPAGPESAGPAPAGPASAGTDPWRLLFTGGPRLGWVFRDRRELIPAYPEPKPGPQAIQEAAAARMTAADVRFQRAWKWAGKPGIGLAVLLVLLTACARSFGGGGFSPLDALITIVVLCGPGLGWTGWCWLQRDQARDVPPEQEYQQAVAGWEQRAAQYADSELARLAEVPEWGSVTVPPRRTDIFGGTLGGWQGLLTVHGASLLAGRPLLIADLTGQHPATPLLGLAQHAGIPSVTWRLPADLGRSGLLGQMPPGQLAAAVAEALHAGAPGGARAERAADAAILRQIAEVLAPRGVTMPRLAAAVRASFGHPAGPLLSAAEQETITGTLFPPGGAREQAAPGLARLNAVLPGLAARAADGWPAPPARCTCLALEAGPRSADTEVLAALLIQWLTVQVSSVTGAIPAVIIAGAEQIATPHLERLADACELRGVPLTLLFRHLRGDAAAQVGGAAATAFMRLGNHQEAEHAAAYLGRHHTYQMSSFTAAPGGTNWSQTQGVQRVYEYRVEPTVLQDLPEQALLFADRTPGTLRLRAVECDPSIVTFRGASTSPLPPPPALPHASAGDPLPAWPSGNNQTGNPDWPA